MDYVVELCLRLKNLLTGSTDQPPMALPDMDTSMPALQDGTQPQQSPGQQDNEILQGLPELMLVLKLPTALEFKQVAQSALDSEPPLMEAFLKYRELINNWQLQYEQLNEQLMQQQLQQQSMHVSMQGGSMQQQVMCQPVSSQMMDGPNQITEALELVSYSNLTSAGRQQLARDILEANPPLMAAFLKHKALVSQQQQHQQQVMHQPFLSEMMEGPPNPGMELPPSRFRQGVDEMVHVFGLPISPEEKQQKLHAIVESNQELRDTLLEFDREKQLCQLPIFQVGMKGGSVQSGNMPGGMPPGMGPVDPMQQQQVHSQQPQTPH